jgi:nucleoside-diphosphate-sugar epimerase
MNVLVTGGTGVLGVPTIAALIARGHHVRALAHTPASAAALRAAGTDPVPGSLFDRHTLEPAVTGVRAVLHLATRIAPPSVAWRRSAWRDNDRIRTEGTANLVQCALATRVDVLVYPSFAPIYADGGSRWLSYGDPLAPTDVLESTVAAEELVHGFTRAGRRGVALRMAGIYGPHSAATRTALKLGHWGVSPFVGRADAYQPLVWDEDAAAALVAAAETPNLSGTFDISDGAPLTRAQLSDALAAAVGRRRVWRPPTPLVRAALGNRMEFLLRSQRVSNRRFVDATGWTPRVTGAATGLTSLAQLSDQRIRHGSRPNIFPAVQPTPG